MQDGAYSKFQLDNGLVVVAEHHPQVRGVSVGAWFKVGSGDESPAINGVSHFIEHLLFKGTEKRNAFDIATELESLGGDLNAFTDREYTCYHATVLKEHLDVAMDVLSDLVLAPTFPKDQIEKERKVLLQEMSMVEETPDEWLADLFVQNVWKSDPLGQPILGTKKTIQNLTRSRIVKYFTEHYRPENMVLAIAGNFDPAALRDRCQRYFGKGQAQKTIPLKRFPSRYRSRRKSYLQDTEQLHVMIGFDGVGFQDKQRYEALILSYYLGGGMSSRLFQEIREKAALAYTVDCDCLPYNDAGLFTIYCAIAHRSLKRSLEIIRKELTQLKKEPIPKDRLDAVVGQLKGTILLAADQVEARQESLGRNETIFGAYVGIDEVIRHLESITPEQVHDLCQRLFVRQKESILTLGRKKYRASELTLFD